MVKMDKTCYSRLAEEYKDKTSNSVIVFNQHKIKTAHMLKEIDAFALVLCQLGFKKSDTLTLYLPTCPQAIVAFYACSKIGVIANIVHPLMPIEKLVSNIKKTKSKGLMFYDILIPDQKALEGTGQILIDCSVTDYVFWRKPAYFAYAWFKSKPSKKTLSYRKLIRHAHKNQIKKVEECKDSEAIVTSMHSGGTSGVPKIVNISNRALNSLNDNLYQMYVGINPVRENEYGMVALPIFHAYGLGVSIHTCLLNHYNLILVPKFNPKLINKLIKKYNVTFMAGVPIMFRKMMEESNFEGEHLAKLKDLWCGGDVVSENFIEHFDEKLKKWGSTARLLRGYGLTEVCSVCSVNTLKDYKMNSCGKPMPNTNIEIWDEDENKLEAGRIGEIAISTDALMSGYEDESGLVEKDGRLFIKTGDLGYLDEDGFLFVLERKKRTIKISAVNVFPSEIEDVAKRHEAVKEACAVSYHYNEKTYIKLYLTLKKEFKQSRLFREMRELIGQNLIRYAIPKEVIVLNEMPRTPLGKINYKKLEVMR